MSTVEDQILKVVSSLPQNVRLWVGFSGGLDSTVLLHALAKMNILCTALHVNHGLSINADIWQHQCRQFAQQREVPFECFSVTVEAQGQGMEAAARSARYDVVESKLGVGDVFLTGHHRDDQVETFFLRLMRGAGLRGLCAMRQERRLGRGRLVRPLLGLSKVQLQQYAREQALSWVEDESNQDTLFDRNYLRHSVMPLLATRWSQAHSATLSAVEHLQAAEDLLEEYGALDLKACNPQSEKWGWSIELGPMEGWSQRRVNHVVRHWLLSNGYKTPDAAQMVEVQKVIAARQDAKPMLHLGGSASAGGAGEYSLARFKTRLYCLPSGKAPQPIAAGSEIVWNPRNPLRFNDGSELRCRGSNLPSQLHVKSRCGGERCKPQGRQHSQSLKKLFQEYDVPPWFRDRAPLIYSDNELVAVADFWLCQRSEGGVLACQFQWILPPLSSVAEQRGT